MRHFFKGCNSWAGRRAATCTLTPAGLQAMPPRYVDTRWNWSRLRPTSSSPVAARAWERCWRQPVRCRYPVGSGYVKSLSRPGGNATGFMMFEYSLCGKWPALLKEIAPHTTRAAVLRDPTVPAGIGHFAVIQSVVGSVGVEALPI